MNTTNLGSFVVPIITRVLTNLRAITEKGAAHAKAKKIDPASLINFRLYPDMLPFSSQIQIASDASKGCLARLAGIDAPRFEDTEKTFVELSARIDKTLAFVSSVTLDQLQGAEQRAIVIKTPSTELNFTGLTYVQGFVIPNLLFHATTAYNTLRHNGVEIGKMDFLGRS
ncbi:MAG: DUF1993 domain-containing protein [Gammaproteobacteria bacterium]|nr:DUF1993 domain-containing protein [Gammaproteobacteria bacterium]